MQLRDVDASSQVYFKHLDHFDGAVEGWSDAEILSIEQQKAVAAASALVANAGPTPIVIWIIRGFVYPPTRPRSVGSALSRRTRASMTLHALRWIRRRSASSRPAAVRTRRNASPGACPTPSVPRGSIARRGTVACPMRARPMLIAVRTSSATRGRRRACAGRACRTRNARILREWRVLRQQVSGSAQLLGDIEYRGASLDKSSGAYCGFVDSATNSNCGNPDITVAPPYTWSP